MKKLISLFFACVVLLVGCSDNAQPTNAQARRLLEKVLAGEQSFTVYNNAVERTYEAVLTDFDYPTDGNALNTFTPSHYTFVDFDDNGVEDLMVLDISLQYTYLFHCEGDRVYGFVCKYVEPKQVKTDGTFQTVKHLYEQKAIVSVTLDGTDCEEHQLAFYDAKNQVYQIQGKATTKQSVEQYFAKWEQETPTVSWSKMEY